MSNFFDKFPKIGYSIGKNADKTTEYALATDIMVRVRVLVERLDQIFHYYEYVVKDGETPEILAERFYGDPEAHWLILLSNNITDPFYDWPLNNQTFDNYIIGKYGSSANAKIGIHHWEAVYKTVNANTQDESIKTITINPNPVSNLIINNAGRGYSSNGYLTLSSDYGSEGNVSYAINSNGSIISLTIENGGRYISGPNVSVSGANTNVADIQSFVATQNLWSELPTDEGGYTSNLIGIYVINTYLPYRNSVSYYDWEFEENEKKRQIKIIKPDYFSQIKQEFLTIMDAATQNKFTPGIKTVS